MPNPPRARRHPDATTAEDEDAAEEGDFSELLKPFAEDQDLDDSMAAEVETGIELEETAEDAGGTEEPVQDLPEIGFDAEAETAANDDGEEFGPEDEVHHDDVAEAEPLGDDAGEEGSEEPDDLVSENLPSLDADANDGSAEDSPVLSEELATSEDEEPPPRAELPWVSVPVASSRPRAFVLQDGAHRIAAGTDVVRVRDDGTPEPLVGEAGGTVTSLVVDRTSTLYATRTGQIFRIVSGGRAERLVGWLDAGSLDPNQALSLELGGPTPSSRPALLLLVSAPDGILLESTDQGSTWRRVDLGGRVLGLSRGSPPMCLVQSGRGAKLARSEPTGGFRFVGAAPAVDEASGAQMAVHQDVVALLEPGAGVHVSCDGGAVLRRVPGTSRATALACGRLGGRPTAFAALFEVATGRASLVLIDAAGADAWVIAEIDAQDEDDDGEFARVVSLAWDEHAETLWAAGAFGLRRWRRTPSA